MAHVIELDNEIRIIDSNEDTRIRLDDKNALTGVATIHNLTDPVNPQDADTKAARDAAIAQGGGGPPSGTAGGDLAGTYPNPTLKNKGGGAVGPVGDSATIPVITVDAQGRVTAVGTATVSGGAPSGTAGGDLAGTYPNPTVTAAGDVSGRIGTLVIGAKKVLASMFGSSTALSGAVPIADGLGGASWNALTASQVGALPSTDDLSAIATANATAANVAMNSHKLTGLANGTSSSDSAAFGQIPTALPPNGTAGGDLTGTYPNPTLATAGAGAAGPIGSTSTVPVVTVDAKGRVTVLGSATPTIDTIGGGSDITTNNVTSTKHGLAPKSPADATQFLNGATTNAYAQVKDSDLSTSDVTTNNASSSKHGFSPKSPADATQFLNGATTPAYAAVKDSDLSTTNVTTNNATTSKHGFVPILPNDATKYYDGTGAYSVPPGGASSPLTTKGDVYTHSTVDARLGVGIDGQGLLADSSQTVGLTWANVVATLSTVDASIVLGGTAKDKTVKTGTINAIAGATAVSADWSNNSHKITSVTDPTNPQDAATKNYVDTAIAGLDWKAACRLATAAALPTNTYSNGSSGVGATLTGVSFGALSVDGTTVVVGDRVLVKNEVTTANNGIYVVTTVGAVATLFVLTRATDYNQTSEIQAGDAVFITAGSTLLDTAWVMTTTGTITVGTTAIVFTQFGAGSNLVSSVFGRTGAVVAATNDYTDAQVQNSPTNKLTTTGDLLYASAANTLARLGIGSGTQVVGVSAGVPAWVAQNLTSVAGRTGTVTLAVADVSGAAPTASPTLTGTVTIPTPSVDDSSTKAASTAYVQGQKGTATPIVDGTAAAGTSAKWTPIDHIHPTDTSRQGVNPRTGSTASSGTPTINTDNVEYYKISALAGAITSFTTNLSGSPAEGRRLHIVITDNGTARAISWGSKFESGAATLPTTTTVSTRLDVAFIYNSDTAKWRCLAAG